MTQAQENLYADVEREAAEEDLGVVDPLQLMAASSSQDPMQAMLLESLQQNQVLLQKLVGGKTTDPVLKALSGGGSDNGSGGSSSGVRGCMAREVFVKAVQDLSLISTVVRNSAMRELGLTPDRLDSSLFRKYMERRIPLAENRLLTHFASMIAEGWATGFLSNNVELMGTMGRMMIYVEQTALDNGRTQLSWLMTGLQDPPYHLLVNHRRRPGMEPFSRLSAASWVSANLAYVRDLDYLEARMTNMQKPSKAALQDVADAEPRPKAKQKPKGKGKGKTAQMGTSNAEASPAPE